MGKLAVSRASLRISRASFSHFEYKVQKVTKATPRVGSVVLVTFPFSNLRGQKVRPALVLAKAEFDNFILCQITSKPYSSKISIKLEPKDFETGELPIISFVRPDKLFTADMTIIKNTVGELSSTTTNKVLKNTRVLFKS